MSRNKAAGTTLGVAGLGAATVGVLTWFRLANQVTLAEDSRLLIIAFLLVPALSIATFIAGTRWYASIEEELVNTAHGGYELQQFADNPMRAGDTLPGFDGLDYAG